MNRSELIAWILLMKNGNEKFAPQPDYAREALRWYDKTLPWLGIAAGVEEAKRESGRGKKVDRKARRVA